MFEWFPPIKGEGPDIHIIVLDNAYLLTDAAGPQREWLENDLKTHSDYLWKLVMYHVPAFVGTETLNPWEPAFEYWVPLFDEYHVDIVFNGHLHGYQRTYPVNWAASQNKTQDYSNGTMYSISGGWGGRLTPEKSYWFMAYQNTTHNFCVVDVYDNNTLRLQAKDIEGNTIDKVTIYKSAEMIQEPVEETRVETEEPETEQRGGIPGYPIWSILAALGIYYLIRDWMK